MNRIGASYKNLDQLTDRTISLVRTLSSCKDNVMPEPELRLSLVRISGRNQQQQFVHNHEKYT